MNGERRMKEWRAQNEGKGSAEWKNGERRMNEERKIKEWRAQNERMESAE